MEEQYNTNNIILKYFLQKSNMLVYSLLLSGGVLLHLVAVNCQPAKDSEPQVRNQFPCHPTAEMSTLFVLTERSHNLR